MRSLASSTTRTVLDRRGARSSVLVALVAVLGCGLAVVTAATTPARAEVGPYRNLAPAATATQSSTEYGGVATRAQDDDTNGAFFDNSVTHTASESQPWWAADLGSVSSIGTIEMWNRTDEATDRLRDFYVLVSDTPILSTNLATARAQAGVSSYHVSSMSGPSVSVNVNRTGRYVRVQLAGTNYLTLAEVKIFSTQTLPAIDAQGWVKNNPFGGFIHYGLGTYTDKQWADPTTPASVFNPSNLDADQWAQAIDSAEMTFGVLTAKHHEGFALWPTAYSTYDVASSPYEGDVVREYVNALRARGLKVGIYFSVWDKHNEETTELVKNQLRELLTRYGQVDYLWLDGWGWDWPGAEGVPYSEIPYQTVRDFIRDVSPTTVVANNDTKRSTATSDVLVWDVPHLKEFPSSSPDPKDASDPLDSNNTWFYTTGTGAPKSAATVKSNRWKLNQANALYLLNVGPDRSGRFTQPYVDRLAEIGKHTLVSALSDKCASVTDRSTANGATIVQWGCATPSDNQTWKLEPAGQGTYRVRSSLSGKVLEVPGYSVQNGTQLVQWSSNGGTNQRWKVEAAGDGYHLRNVHSGKCASVADWSTADGAALVQWTCGTGSTNQIWRLE